MAKRKSQNRLSNRFSKRKSISSIGSGMLDPDTNTLDDEQSFWWNNLEENTIMPHSLMYNKREETAKYLNLSSQLDSTRSSVEWWKNLETSDNEHNTPIISRRNISAAIVRTNVLETSTSESDKEINVKKRKMPLRGTSRKSENNAFLNALNNEVATSSKTSQKKETRSSSLHGKASDSELPQRKSHRNKEDSLSLSPTVNILKLRPNIFKRRQSRSIKDQNVFQDALTEDDMLNDSTGKKSITPKKASSSMNQIIRSMNQIADSSNKKDTDDRTKVINSLDHNEDNTSNVPETQSSTVQNNNSTSVVTQLNKIIEYSDASSSDASSKILKPKSRFLRNMRGSMKKSTFADVLADDKNVSSLRHGNLSREIDIREMKSRSSINLSSSSLKESADMSKSKTDATRASPITRSASLRQGSRSPSSNIATRRIRDNSEQNAALSSDDSESRKDSSAFLKPKSRLLIRQSKRKSPTKNLFEEIFNRDGNVDAREGDVAALAEDNRASVEKRNETAVSQSHDDLNKTTRHSDNSDASSKILKPKSRFLQNVRRSAGENVFEDVLADNKDVSSPRHRNPSREIDIHEMKSRSSMINRSSGSLEESVDMSKSRKSDATRESPITRSASLRVRTRSPSSNVATRRTRDNSEQNTATSSSDDSRKNSGAFLKPKSRFLMRQSKKSSPTRNLFEEIFKRGGSADAREDNAATLTEDNRAARVEKRNETAVRAGQSRGSLTTGKDNARLDSDDMSELLLDTSRGLSLSSSERNQELDVQAERRLVGEASEGGDAAGASRSTSRKTRTPEKRVSPIRRPKGDTSEISRKRTTSSNTIPVPPVVTNDDSRDELDREREPNVPAKRSSRANLSKEARSTRSTSRNQSPKAASKDTVELSRRSVHWTAEIDNVSDASVDVGTEEDNISRADNLARNSTSVLAEHGRASARDESTARTSSKTLGSEEEAEMDNDENAIPATETTRQGFSPNRSTSGTSDKTANRRTLSRTSIAGPSSNSSVKEARETARRQESLNGPRSFYSSTPIKASNKSANVSGVTSFKIPTSTPIKAWNKSANISKVTSSKAPRTIDDFFKVRQPSSATDKRSANDRFLASSRVFADSKRMEEIKEELERIKNRERAEMKIGAGKTGRGVSASSAKNARTIGAAQKKKRLVADPAKMVDKALLVNGKVYKAPRLPRPKHWATDHLYKFLWKCMESKYKMATRVQSEKFVLELAKMVSLIERRKKYDSYKAELAALMKEMARLRIINTRKDFYDFCHDFLPYEFRVKVIPMLLPGNKRIVPYDPTKLHTPLLEE